MYVDAFCSDDFQNILSEELENYLFYLRLRLY